MLVLGVGTNNRASQTLAAEAAETSKARFSPMETAMMADEAELWGTRELDSMPIEAVEIPGADESSALVIATSTVPLTDGT
jgi:hypothetical protein